MNLTSSQKEKVKLLVEQAILKVEDRPILLKELEGIISEMEGKDDFTLIPRISVDETVYVFEVLERLDKVVETYVKHTDVNDIESLENCKKELSIQLMYLSTYKDKFLYEIDYLEDVFKKEIFSKLTSEISLKDGISFTQAEKKVPADPRYCNLREQITQLKTNMMTIKTRYDFFSKMIQVIIQSISVAGKEQYANKMTN